MAPTYDPEQIETKWQDVWERERTFVVDNPTADEVAAGKGPGVRRTCSRCSPIPRAAPTWGT